MLLIVLAVGREDLDNAEVYMILKRNYSIRRMVLVVVHWFWIDGDGDILAV
jgi:hypothetical protein